MKSMFDWIVIGLAVVGVLTALIFLPAMELIPAQVEPGSIAPGLSPVRVPALMEGYKDVGEKVSGWFGGPTNLQPYVEGDPKSVTQAPGELKVYSMWGVFLSLAMVLAALAYSVIGRFESEEKTVLPVKK
jgi:hypothetical protein